jgi:4-amino-4-deoxy-L-arabinose transferase-like glycosyltransferase
MPAGNMTGPPHLSAWADELMALPSSGADPGPPAGVLPARRSRLADLVRHPCTWIVVVAFGLRLLWVLLVPSRPVGDFALYREAAAYLLDQGRLDPEFIYMPGYVFLLAGVQALGGGLLAAKMIGVVTGTAIVIAVGGIADRLFGRRAGIVATALAALWPAGIAVASVTGTDVPAAALIAVGVFSLVALAPDRPWLAAAICGFVLGLGAMVRAVAAPLSVMSLLYWLAMGIRWPVAVGRTVVALAIAFALLLPWGLRNQKIYGEFFFTDSHGGNTALVGANPNSEGTYSRSLNLMFVKATGLKVLESPSRHRESDRVAYDLASRWRTFEPAYAAGLVAVKADRLLTYERNLLYWPVFRQGVLRDGQRAFFDAHRTALDRLADGFWWLLVAFGAAGVAICAARRSRTALALLGFPLILAAIYTLFFSEVRYHLAIAPFVFPYAAAAIDWVVSSARDRFRDQRRVLLIALLAMAGTFGGWAGLLTLGEFLRAGHRWAVAVCAYPDAAHVQLCSWRRVQPRQGESPVRGVWDGVGLRLRATSRNDVLAAARTIVPLGPGRYRIRAKVSVTGGAGSPTGPLSVALRTGSGVFARAVPPSAPDRQDARTMQNGALIGAPVDVPIAGVVDHLGGPFLLDVEIEPGGIGSTVDGAIVWISQLVVERF